MRIGHLEFERVVRDGGVVPPTLRRIMDDDDLPDILLASIDPALSDSLAFCQAYDIAPQAVVNCVVVEAKHSAKTHFAACLVLAADKIDMNGVVRRYLEARKVSFAPMETVSKETGGMEQGGISPLGLPQSWMVLVDESVAVGAELVIGSGSRSSKLLVAGRVLSLLPNAVVLDIKKRQ